jgi:hypothetical protein
MLLLLLFMWFRFLRYFRDLISPFSHVWILLLLLFMWFRFRRCFRDFIDLWILIFVFVNMHQINYMIVLV